MLLKVNNTVFQQNHTRYETIVILFLNASVAQMDMKKTKLKHDSLCTYYYLEYQIVKLLILLE